MSRENFTSKVKGWGPQLSNRFRSMSQRLRSDSSDSSYSPSKAAATANAATYVNSASSVNSANFAYSADSADSTSVPSVYAITTSNIATPTTNATANNATNAKAGKKFWAKLVRSKSTDKGLVTSQASDSGNAERGGEEVGSTVDADGVDRKQVFGVDENEERGNWTGQADFILSLLGYAVGLGNVWRFPYLCYKNGGGAFLIPYAIVLILVGMPMFYMELVMGQFTSCGPLTCWDFAPLFKGLGLAQLIISAEVSIYYNMIIAWSLFYLFSSFINIRSLPWASCFNYWNSDVCYDKIPDTTCNQSHFTKASDGVCYNYTERVGVWNSTLFDTKRPSASEEYYNRRVLRLSPSIDVMGKVEWDLTLSLLLAWIISFLCMVKGIKTTGKVVYFTAIFPYVVLFVLFARGLTLENSAKGILYFLKPDFSRLADATVWSDAAVQMFYSMSNCWGGLIALASYNRFHNNCYRDTIIVTLVNFFTGILAGLVIFSFLGYMAHVIGTSVEKVVDQGPGLAFVVYPQSVTMMPVSPLWAILFFLMLLTLGLDSQFCTLETVLTAVIDQWPVLRPHKSWAILVLCIILFLLGLPLCTHGGNYFLDLMNSYCSGWNLLLIGLIESIAIAWVYGSRRFGDDIRIMLGSRPGIWWRICWLFLTPIFLAFVLIFQFVKYTHPSYGSLFYPPWAEALGWLMAISSVIWIPIVAVVLIYKEEGATLWQRIKKLTSPTIYWGPALIKHRRLVDYVEGFEVNPWKTEEQDSGRHSLPDTTDPNAIDDTGSISRSSSSTGSGGQGKDNPTFIDTFYTTQSEASDNTTVNHRDPHSVSHM